MATLQSDCRVATPSGQIRSQAILGDMADRYLTPSGRPVVLSVTPVLASWMGRRHPDQVRLGTFLTAMEEDTRHDVDGLDGEMVVELVVGLGPAQPLTQHRDLDNYLLPVVARLGHQRVVAAFAVKHHADQSTLTVGVAECLLNDDPAMLEVRAVGSYERATWKEQIRSAAQSVLGHCNPHSGTAALDVSFTTSSARNWTSLWKPTIDAIAGPLLGVPDPKRPWSANDDHITRLGLHHFIDDSMGFDVIIRAWWTLDQGR
jgi:hypothetical protein